MKCEVCDVQTATMWVERPCQHGIVEAHRHITQIASFQWTHTECPGATPIVSCDDCGPQAGYKILAPLEPTTTR